MNMLTQGRKALIARLETIALGQGYQTTAGTNVKTGWFNEVVKASATGYPMIVVQMARGKAPESGPLAMKVFHGFSVIGAVDAGLDDYESAIEDLEQDLIQCLMPRNGVLPDWMPRGITGITIGAPEIFPPAEGLKAATVLVPVQLHTIVQELRHDRKN